MRNSNEQREERGELKKSSKESIGEKSKKMFPNRDSNPGLLGESQLS